MNIIILVIMGTLIWFVTLDTITFFLGWNINDSSVLNKSLKQKYVLAL